MKRLKGFTLASVLVLLSQLGLFASKAWAETAAPLEGFVDTNGVRLQYLDWGGAGPWLILIHGLADNPYVFDDLAPAFTNRYRVIAYARRGSGSSDMKGPYDIATLTEDLHGLMNALRIERADLVGYSAGSDEITEMAARYPDKVSRIVYFEGGYDWAGRDFATLVKALPVGFFDPPRSAMVSLDAFRAYQKTQMYPALDDIGRIDANIRQKVVIQSDGTLKYRIPKSTVDALYSSIWANKQRDYTRVRCPALAIYSDHLYDLDITDGQRRSNLVAYEQKYWMPFQNKSRDRMQRELSNLQVVQVPGAHSSFFMTNRQQVLEAMDRFLGEAPRATARMTQQSHDSSSP